MMEQPDDNAPATFRPGELIGKFQGEKAATGPIGCRNTVCRIPSSLGITRPYIRKPSVASHSMMSQPLQDFEPRLLDRLALLQRHADRHLVHAFANRGWRPSG